MTISIQHREQEIIPKPTISSQILNHSQTSLAIRNSRVKVVLLAMLVHTEALEVNVPSRTKLRLDRSRDVDRRLHGKLLHTALHDREVDRDDTSHLNGAAERDLAIALREVQVADRELGARDVDGQVDFAAAGQVLDIAVASVFRAAGHSASAFSADFLFDVCARAAGVDVFGLGR